MKLNRKKREKQQKALKQKKTKQKRKRSFCFSQNKSLTNKNHNRKEAQLKVFPKLMTQRVLNTQVFKKIQQKYKGMPGMTQ